MTEKYLILPVSDLTADNREDQSQYASGTCKQKCKKLVYVITHTKALQSSIHPKQNKGN